MNDKTAIEKIKDAAERAKNQIENCFPVCDPEIETDPFEWAETVSVRVRSIMSNLDAILEAIAALDAEKPAVDAVSIRVDTDSIREAVIKIGMNFMRSFMFAAEIDLIKFAEAYHAKKRAVERLRTLEEIQEVKRLGNLASIGIVIDRLMADAKKAVES